MAEEDLAEAVDLHRQRMREIAEEGEFVVVQLLVHPAGPSRPELHSLPGSGDLAVAVAPDEGRPAVAQQAQRILRHRPEGDVAADEDGVRVDLGEHRFERRQVPVHVVEGGDPHLVKRETDSTCGVCGNMSTGRTRSSV